MRVHQRVHARVHVRSVSINYSYLSIAKMLVVYLLVAHWSACALVLPTTFADHPVLTWLGYYGYCVAETANASLPAAMPGEGYPYDDCYRTINLARGLHSNRPLIEQLLASGTCTVRCERPLDLFMAAYYFTLQIICGATGGPVDREGFDVYEQLLFAILTAIGALVWGQVIDIIVPCTCHAHAMHMPCTCHAHATHRSSARSSPSSLTPTPTSHGFARRWTSSTR